MVKKLIKCLNMKVFSLMKDTFIVMGKNHSVREFIISTLVKCLKRTMKNICEIQSIHFIRLKESKTDIYITLKIHMKSFTH